MAARHLTVTNTTNDPTGRAATHNTMGRTSPTTQLYDHPGPDTNIAQYHIHTDNNADPATAPPPTKQSKQPQAPANMEALWEMATRDPDTNDNHEPAGPLSSKPPPPPLPSLPTEPKPKPLPYTPNP